MNRFRWVTVCLAAGIGLAAWGQKMDLKVNYEPGVYTTTQTTITTSKTEGYGQSKKSAKRMVVVMERSVGQADAKGNREIALTFRHAKSETLADDGSVTQTHDTATEPESTDPMIRAYRAVIGKPFIMTIHPTGFRIGNFKGQSEIAKAAKREDFLVGKVFGDLSNGIGHTTMLSWKPVDVGESWETLGEVLESVLWGKHVYTLKEVADGVAMATVKGTATYEYDQWKEMMKNAPGGTILYTGPPLTITKADGVADRAILIDVATGMITSITSTVKSTSVVDDGMEKVTTVIDQQQEYTCTKGAYKAPKAE